MPTPPAPPEVDEPARVFAALGDRTRLALVTRMSAGEPLSITRLTAGTSLTRQAVTRHLAVLADAGLVRGARRGREHLWQLDRARLRLAQRSLDQIAAWWDERLADLKDSLEHDSSC